MYAKNDNDWSNKVALIYGHECAWPGCKSKVGLASHHIFSRGIKSLRLLIENGIHVCFVHHRKLESLLKKRKEYEKILIIMIGKNRWDNLFDIKNRIGNEESRNISSNEISL